MKADGGHSPDEWCDSGNYLYSISRIITLHSISRMIIRDYKGFMMDL